VKGVKGIEELNHKLNALRGIAQGNPIQEAVKAGCLIIQLPAIRKAPYRSGTLRRSITIEVQTKDNIVIGKIGTNVEYAPRLEFGFAGTDKLGRTYNQAAKPFLRPAFDNYKQAALNEISDILSGLIKNV
jgi:HK97 gp10 family phage protein